MIRKLDSILKRYTRKALRRKNQSTLEMKRGQMTKMRPVRRTRRNEIVHVNEFILMTYDNIIMEDYHKIISLISPSVDGFPIEYAVDCYIVS